MLSRSERSEGMHDVVSRFAFVTPPAMATDVPRLLLGHATNTSNLAALPDPLHNSAVALNVAFPDASLLQYDCGKLQQLDALMRQLVDGGHRALIFTQMTKVLDILEKFFNYHGYRYLRLDGATKVEQRQALTERLTAMRVSLRLSLVRALVVWASILSEQTPLSFMTSTGMPLSKHNAWIALIELARRVTCIYTVS